MSGYAGIISPDNTPPDRALLDRMAADLAFRGPNATHVTTQPGADFVFTFLKTGPAPQSPQQPVTLDNRLWLIGDVRLNGRDDLRRKLEQHGASLPRTVTDEDLTLHFVSQFGIESLPELDGDFSRTPVTARYTAFVTSPAQGRSFTLSTKADSVSAILFRRSSPIPTSHATITISNLSLTSFSALPITIRIARFTPTFGVSPRDTSPILA